VTKGKKVPKRTMWSFALFSVKFLGFQFKSFRELTTCKVPTLKWSKLTTAPQFDKLLCLGKRKQSLAWRNIFSIHQTLSVIVLVWFEILMCLCYFISI
jgi:hypothetical protein